MPRRRSPCLQASAGNQRLARSATATMLAGVMISPALLISDLGRPERFLNMLRVFKPSSPMSVGSWILSAFGAAAAGGAARELAGALPRVGRGSQVAAALLGPALSTYTATLISTTSIPVWHEARHHLPFVFASGSAATAGAAALLLTPPAAAEPARRLAVGASAVELAVIQAMERRLGAAGRPYHEGTPGRLSRAAKLFTGGGAAAMALGRASAYAAAGRRGGSGRRRPGAIRDLPSGVPIGGGPELHLGAAARAAGSTGCVGRTGAPVAGMHGPLSRGSCCSARAW